MILFLTSNIGGIKKENDERKPTKLFTQNEFLDNLKKHIKGNDKFVLVSSNPENYQQNDMFLEMDKEALNSIVIYGESYKISKRRDNVDM